MSISWAYFRPQGPPRRQALQNQLPESLRAMTRVDEARGEHHEHQLGVFPATGPSQVPGVAKPTARVIARI